MGKTGKFTVSGLKKLQTQLNKIQEKDMDEFLEACAKELAARLLAKVIKRTPVGQYPASSGKKGGTLRRGWTSGKNGGKGTSDPNKFVDSLQVNHVGNMYTIEIKNPVEYASYVEYGHRTRGKNGWVQGRFMLTISEQEIQEIAPNVLEAKLKEFLGGALA